MRIQDTDRILKEARAGRRAAGHDRHDQEQGLFSRALQMITRLFRKR